MALTEADIEQFIEALHGSADLRERVRAAILSDEFQALPGMIQRLVEQGQEFREDLRRHDARMDQLTERMDHLTASVDRLTAKVQNIDGRLGNIEGWRYEEQYRRNIKAHLAEWFEKVQVIDLGDFEPFKRARREGTLTAEERRELVRTDLLASAQPLDDTAPPPVVVLLELSIVVDASDVARAHRRAGILRKTGIEVWACVDGDAIEPGAKAAAEELGVMVLVHREAAAA